MLMTLDDSSYVFRGQFYSVQRSLNDSFFVVEGQKLSSVRMILYDSFFVLKGQSSFSVQMTLNDFFFFLQIT